MLVLPLDTTVFSIFFRVHVALSIRKKCVTPLKLKNPGAVLTGKKTKGKDLDQDTRKGLMIYQGLGGGRRQTRQSRGGGTRAPRPRGGCRNLSARLGQGAWLPLRVRSRFLSTVPVCPHCPRGCLAS